MQDALSFIEEKATMPKEWLRREPRETHPAILALVREAKTDADLFYDDDVERYVNERIPGMPPHERHGERDPLVAQLGHEVYVAKSQLSDEKNAHYLASYLAEGYTERTAERLDGERYTVRFGTVYVGQTVPQYGEPCPVRAKLSGGRIVLLPKGSRSKAYMHTGPILVRDGWV